MVPPDMTRYMKLIDDANQWNEAACEVTDYMAIFIQQ